MIRHLVFDFDGVLVRGTNEAYFRCYEWAAREAGIPLSSAVVHERILMNWGESVRKEVEGLLPDHPEKVNEVIARYESKIEEEMLLSAVLIPGAAETLTQLSEQYSLSIISGMNIRSLKILLSRFGIEPCLVDYVSTCRSHDPAKQKSTGYHLGELMKTRGLASSEVICVGDGSSDVSMAQNKGVRIVVVLTGILDEPSARRLGVSDILPDVSALPEWLRKETYN